MTASLRTTAFVLLASLPVGIGGARAQHMEPPRFEQTEAPRVLPPPPPPAPRPPPPREPAPSAPVPPQAPAPQPPPSSPRWRAAPAAPLPRPAPASPPSVQSPPPAPVPPPSVQSPPPARVQSPPARLQLPPVRSPPPARVQAPPPSPARPDADDGTDDPKMWRRLGPRISVPQPPPAASPTPPAPPRAPATARPAPAPLPPSPLPPPPVSAPAAAADADQTTLVRPYTPAREPTFEPTLPRLKIGLRRFEFVRIGASNSPDGVAAAQTFNNFSVDVYPVSRLVRIGLTSAFGWESGMFLTNGDYFATQTVSLGAQYRDFGRVVPFAEAFMGVGYMRRLQFDRAIPTAFWNFGVDAGVEIYVARVGYLSLALGYMRPVNGFARRQIFTSVYVDTWSLKIGIGI